MNNYLLIFGCFFITACATLGLGGCGNKVPQISYYSLMAADLAPSTAVPAKGMALLVGPISLPDILKNSQIVTGRTGERYQRSDNHRWSGEVDRDFARSLGEYLSRRLGTEQISLYPMSQSFTPTHQVVCDILTMDGVLGQEARLVVRWSLLDPATKTVSVTRRSFCRQQPADNSYDAWVAAQRDNIGCVSEEIAVALRAKNP
nr:PqiC family protein [uncultured Desulfobulbus sp.]